VTPAVQPRRALVLGGGGVLGFAWMLGALSAVEEVSGIDVGSVEVVVGTSAGSVVAALLGCGLSVDAVSRHHQGVPAPSDPVISYDYDASTGPALPPRPGLRPGSPRLVLDGVRHPRRTSPIVTLSGLLPTGRGTLAPIHDLIDTVAGAAGAVDSWPAAPRPWIVAADYRTGRRVVFGQDASALAANRAPRPERRASLADAVTASCAIPAWYPPQVIGGIPYVDGGTVSNASTDLLLGTPVEEVFVLAPMASVEVDRPRTALTRLERLVRRAITKTIMADVARLRAAGVRVCVVTPGPEDLAVMGVNLMNPARRTEVFETARRTSASPIRAQLASESGWSATPRRPGRSAGGAGAGQTPA
jgi:NTE family protein